jgi:8-oxo-dGTP pyrophosphatase MutT (NUDIX family)
MENEVYRGNIVQVTEEKIEDIVWERVYLPSGVVIFPIDDQGRILMVEEKRPHETPPIRLKPVSGMLEPDKGSPAENAQRELQEEIGFKATELINYWTLKGSGTINHLQYFFLARNLIPSKLPNPDGEDTIISIKAFSVEELLQKYLADEIRWSMSTLGFMRLYHFLGGRLDSSC